MPRPPADSTTKIEVRLTPEKTVIRPGETLSLRVEIWNVGTDDVLIAQKVDATYGNSDLRLFLEYVDMDPIEFPGLRKTGYYRVGAEYYSRGISSTPGWNGGYLKQADIEKLPFKAWQGTIDSNVVTIKVTPWTSKKGK